MMKSIIVLLAVVVSFSVSPAFAKRDIEAKYSIQKAMASSKVKEALREEVALFWGNQNVPTYGSNLGEIKTSKRSSAFRKKPEEACQWAFASAVRALQDNVRREGGDAIINIQSNINDIPTSSETEFDCTVGAMMVNVALKGTVVKLN